MQAVKTTKDEGESSFSTSGEPKGLLGLQSLSSFLAPHY